MCAISRHFCSCCCYALQLLLLLLCLLLLLTACCCRQLQHNESCCRLSFVAAVAVLPLLLLCFPDKVGRRCWHVLFYRFVVAGTAVVCSVQFSHSTI